MQTELAGLNPTKAIQILGVNDSGLDSGNEEICNGRSIPWLQPEAGNDVWTPWEVVYRDVIILGAGNERIGTYNLTEFDLADPANYATLRDLLLAGANE